MGTVGWYDVDSNVHSNCWITVLFRVEEWKFDQPMIVNVETTLWKIVETTLWKNVDSTLNFGISRTIAANFDKKKWFNNKDIFFMFLLLLYYCFWVMCVMCVIDMFLCNFCTGKFFGRFGLFCLGIGEQSLSLPSFSWKFIPFFNCCFYALPQWNKLSWICQTSFFISSFKIAI